MKNYENIPDPDLLTDKQAAEMVKNMPQYLALLDFKKDIKKVRGLHNTAR